ncbi:Peroxisomal biogenesis factor 6 [Frankliniella fusca]|uniref:Peroxisomal biogenesis factor 6 n=1 Tax=Frankliniella fusca TaxID=407009 RepID=A0AAE1HLV6_9NEOP|nr:Peroxisomal biogenesis factor 6 [Frankliniella fusca]
MAPTSTATARHQSSPGAHNRTMPPVASQPHTRVEARDVHDESVSDEEQQHEEEVEALEAGQRGCHALDGDGVRGDELRQQDAVECNHRTGGDEQQRLKAHVPHDVPISPYHRPSTQAGLAQWQGRRRRPAGRASLLTCSRRTYTTANTSVVSSARASASLPDDATQALCPGLFLMERRPEAGAQQPPQTAVLDVRDLCGRDIAREKEAVLPQAEGVRRLSGVVCNTDPGWSLQLLQRAAPTVEEVSVFYSREPHLRAVHAMPRLRRLFLWGDDGALDAQPPELDELPPQEHDAGLRWLAAWLPRATLQSLLRAHGRTLVEVQLMVGTAAGPAGQHSWPASCSDLDALLEPCGLRALRTLVLWRVVAWLHEPAACREQRDAVRRVLPAAAEVLCGLCDRAVWQRF